MPCLQGLQSILLGDTLNTWACGQPFCGAQNIAATFAKRQGEANTATPYFGEGSRYLRA